MCQNCSRKKWKFIYWNMIFVIPIEDDIVEELDKIHTWYIRSWQNTKYIISEQQHRFSAQWPACLKEGKTLHLDLDLPTCFRGAAGSDPRMAGRLTCLCLRVLGGGQRLAPGGHLALASNQQRINQGQFMQSRFQDFYEIPSLKHWKSTAANPFTAFCKESADPLWATSSEDCPGGRNGADTDCHWWVSKFQTIDSGFKDKFPMWTWSTMVHAAKIILNGLHLNLIFLVFVTDSHNPFHKSAL